MNGEAEDRFDARAGEDAVGAGARLGEHAVEEESERAEAVGDGEGTSHPLVGGMVVAEGVDAGGPLEDVEIVRGEGGVVAEAAAEEAEEVGRGEGGRELGLEEANEAGGGGGGEGERGKRRGGGDGGGEGGVEDGGEIEAGDRFRDVIEVGVTAQSVESGDGRQGFGEPP